MLRKFIGAALLAACAASSTPAHAFRYYYSAPPGQPEYPIYPPPTVSPYPYWPRVAIYRPVPLTYYYTPTLPPYYNVPPYLGPAPFYYWR
jgi:hypothetical protein